MATGQSGQGAYAITCGGLTSPDYEITWIAGTLTVIPAAPPSVSAPDADLALGALREGKAPIPVSVRFSVSDPDGIASTRLEHRSGLGAYAPVYLASATATGVTLYMGSSSKTSHQFGAQATDTAGASSPLVEGPAFRVKVLQEGSSGIKAKGAWSRGRLGGAFGGSVAGASKANASQSLTLTASDLAIVSTRGKDRGMARVLLDGKAVTTIDLYAPVTKAGQVVWSTSFPTAARHMVALVALGKKSPKGKGTRVDLDAFVTLIR